MLALRLYFGGSCTVQ